MIVPLAIYLLSFCFKGRSAQVDKVEADDEATEAPATSIPVGENSIHNKFYFSMTVNVVLISILL